MRFSQLLIAIMTACLAVSGAKAQEYVDNAIVFLADVSSSMDEDERRIVRESHAQAISSFEVLDAIEQGATQRIAVAYVEFASEAHALVEWTIVDSPQSARAFAQAILAADKPKMNKLTGIGEALNVALTLFGQLPYEPLLRTVDVAGDGKNNIGIEPSVPRALLLDMGATINALPMILDTRYPDLPDYFAAEIMGGPRAFSIELRDIRDMPMMLRRKLIIEIG